MLNGVTLQPLGSLVAQHNAIQNHGRSVALGLGGFEQLDGHLSLASTSWGIQDLGAVAHGKATAQIVQNLGLVISQL